MAKKPSSLPTIKEYLQWDIYTWSNALVHWENILRTLKLKDGLALEIGSRDGGLTLFLAYNFDLNVVCSDLNGPTENAKELHKFYGIHSKVKYESANALSLKYDNDTFDIVILKSVLGAVGANNNFKNQQKAIQEIYRVLKSEGTLLFAENSTASFIHRYLRKKFRNWSSYWRYISIEETHSLLQNFVEVRIFSVGFLSSFFLNKFLKKLIYPVDKIITNLISPNSKYVIYGSAKKPLQI